jgi:hypothetical protein
MSDKRCPGCGNVYPATVEYYHRRTASKDGLATRCKNCVREYHRQYRAVNHKKDLADKCRYRKENKEKIREKRAEYYRQNKEKIRARNRAYFGQNTEKVKEAQRRYNKKNREHQGELNIIQRRKQREKVIAHYGGKCACCGESRYEFMAIDHIDGGGSKHRKEIGQNSTVNWLVKNNFPDGFRVKPTTLCTFVRSKQGKLV